MDNTPKILHFEWENTQKYIYFLEYFDMVIVFNIAKNYLTYIKKTIHMTILM